MKGNGGDCHRPLQVCLVICNRTAGLHAENAIAALRLSHGNWRHKMQKPEHTFTIYIPNHELRQLALALVRVVIVRTFDNSFPILILLDYIIKLEL